MKPPSSASQPYQLKHFKYSSHYWILKFLAQNKSGPLRILDVGTADGYLGALLKAQGHYVVGVERESSLAALARASYDRLHITDIEEFDFPDRDEFDYILFADVLEHLRYPAAVLHRALPSIKSAGELVISVPNIANVVVRLSLLVGRFDYTERGILDKTHLRFFTRRTIAKLLEDCGYRLVDVIATPLPVQLVLPFTEAPVFFPLHEIHFGLTRAWKRMLGYQFVIRAKPAAVV
jgi:2-polyprenyl-3-methyl-5-hydroxy-6-metoxy-1,4-benzoquinol methylase